MSFHGAQVNNHPIENWVFANSAGRLALNGVLFTYTVFDLGKVGFQSDTGTYWRLIAITPTWIPLSSIANNKVVSTEPGISGLTGGGSSKLDGYSVIGLSYGFKLIVTIADSDSTWTYQSGAVDTSKGDIATLGDAGGRWRKTGGY